MSSVFEFEAIGTHWKIEIFDEISDSRESDIFASVRNRIDVYDKHYSRFRSDSLVTEMSRSIGIYPLPDDAKLMFDLYEKVYRITNGAVTPLIGNLLEETGYDATYSLEPKELHHPPAWRDAINYKFPQLEIKQPVLAFNLGQGGTANDKIALRAFSAVKFLKPDYLVVQWTHTNRSVYVAPDNLVYDWWNFYEHELKEGGDAYDHIKRKAKYFEDVQSMWNDSHRLLITARTTGMALSQMAQSKSFGYVQHMMFRGNISTGADLTSAERQSMPLLADDMARKAVAMLVDGSW